MCDVFEACFVMGKYLKGIKEAEGEMQRRVGDRGDTTFLHFCGVVYALSLTG